MFLVFSFRKSAPSAFSKLNCKNFLFGNEWANLHLSPRPAYVWPIGAALRDWFGESIVCACQSNLLWNATLVNGGGAEREGGRREGIFVLFLFCVWKCCCLSLFSVLSSLFCVPPAVTGFDDLRRRGLVWLPLYLAVKAGRWAVAPPPAPERRWGGPGTHAIPVPNNSLGIAERVDMYIRAMLSLVEKGINTTHHYCWNSHSAEGLGESMLRMNAIGLDKIKPTYCPTHNIDYNLFGNLKCGCLDKKQYGRRKIF